MNKTHDKSKVYLTIDDLEEKYSLKRSFQAALRMKKLIPYIRPAGSRLVLYEDAAIQEWLKSWEVT